MDKKVKVTTNCVLKFDEGQLEIKANKDGLASLTEIWRQAGSPDSKRPKDWMEMVETQNFIVYIRSLKGSNSTLLQVKPGRSGGTYAEVQIALKYAQYLSPEFQRQVNDVVIESIEEEVDPELGIQRAVERLDKKMKALGRSDESVAKRLKTIAKRNQLTDTLAKHGRRARQTGGRTASSRSPTPCTWAGKAARPAN